MGKEFFISLDMPNEKAIKEYKSIVIEVDFKGVPKVIIYYQRKDGSTSNKAVSHLKTLPKKNEQNTKRPR